jgi:hypothetical protein
MPPLQGTAPEREHNRIKSKFYRSMPV